MRPWPVSRLCHDRLVILLSKLFPPLSLECSVLHHTDNSRSDWQSKVNANHFQSWKYQLSTPGSTGSTRDRKQETSGFSSRQGLPRFDREGLTRLDQVLNISIEGWKYVISWKIFPIIQLFNFWKTVESKNWLVISCHLMSLKTLKTKVREVLVVDIRKCSRSAFQVTWRIKL